jgi:hypothetical protein
MYEQNIGTTLKNSLSAQKDRFYQPRYAEDNVGNCPRNSSESEKNKKEHSMKRSPAHEHPPLPRTSMQLDEGSLRT